MFKVLIARGLLRLFYLFPVDNRKVFFSSYEGASVSCNPKYIFQELTQNRSVKSVWEYNGTEKPSIITGIITVKHNSLKYIYHIMTSGTIITNTAISAVFPLRSNQLGINTWHGSGCYKKAGVDYSETNKREYIWRLQFNEKNTNYYISGCQAWTEVFSKAVLSNPKKFLPFGSPRNDNLINGIDQDSASNILKKLGISSNKRIVLYAPTYRGGRELPDEAICPIDVKKLLNSLEQRFGGEWIFAYRCHYATACKFQSIDRAIDLSGYEDMQELLAVANVFISDYSSAIWDFSLTLKPCFLFCYDLDNYIDERDFYIPIKNWHFPVSETEKDLFRQIICFNNDDYVSSIKKHHKELGSYEQGVATKKVVELIEDKMGI